MNAETMPPDEETTERRPPVKFTDFEPQDRILMRLGVHYGLRCYVAGRKFGSVMLLSLGSDEKHVRAGRSADYQVGVTTQLEGYTP